jgi:hypothetical protein
VGGTGLDPVIKRDRSYRSDLGLQVLSRERELTIGVLSFSGCPRTRFNSGRLVLDRAFFDNGIKCLAESGALLCGDDPELLWYAAGDKIVRMIFGDKREVVIR